MVPDEASTLGIHIRMRKSNDVTSSRYASESISGSIRGSQKI